MGINPHKIHTLRTDDTPLLCGGESHSVCGVIVSLNWKEINCILDELDLPGAQIQKVYQSSFDLLVFELYGRRRDEAPRAAAVLVCLSPRSCRINESFRPLPKSEKPLRFAEFLKARIVNGRIEEAVQLGDNRIIRIVIRRGENRYRLYIRLWSNAANVIVTGEDGIILDAMRRLPRRGETGGGVYLPENAASAGPATASAGAGAVPDKSYEIREFPGEPGRSFNRQVDDWYALEGGGPSLGNSPAERWQKPFPPGGGPGTAPEKGSGPRRGGAFPGMGRPCPGGAPGHSGGGLLV